MHVPINIEKCYLADEVARWKASIERHEKRSVYRKAVLDEMDRGLPDYPRPLKMMPLQAPGAWMKRVARYGILGAVLKLFIP